MVPASNSGRILQSDDLHGRRKSFKCDPTTSGRKPEKRVNWPQTSREAALESSLVGFEGDGIWDEGEQWGQAGK